MNNTNKMVTAVTLLALYLLLPVAIGEDPNGIDKFLLFRMVHFPAWLEENHLDPSNPELGPVLMSLSNDYVNIDVFVRNHRMAGLSHGIKNINIKSGLGQGTIDIYFYSGKNIEYSGDYTANGTYGFSEKKDSLERSGNYTISYGKIGAGFKMKYKVVDGKVNVIEYGPAVVFMMGPVSQKTLSIASLYNGTGALAGYIKEQAEQKFDLLVWGSDEKRSENDEPLFTLLKKYFEQELQGTTMDEIMRTSSK